MVEPFYFGESPRMLFGALHAATRRRERALLVCPAVLHDAMRSRRSLWTLCESLAAGACDVLRFDWFGTGESSGDPLDLSLAGMLDDLGAARSMLRTLSADAPLRMLALRSSCLPLLAFAHAQAGPVDLVLWDPRLDGAALVAQWRRKHHAQLHEAGRYPYGRGEPRADELLGFRIRTSWLDELAALDFTARPLPVGSRVLVAGWHPTPAVERFIAAQRAGAVSVDWMALPAGETPALDRPELFERQVFPRRSVAELGERLAERVV